MFRVAWRAGSRGRLTSCCIVQDKLLKSDDNTGTKVAMTGAVGHEYLHDGLAVWHFWHPSPGSGGTLQALPLIARCSRG